MIVSRSFKLISIALSLATLACLSACKLETEPANSSPGEITAFALLKADNPRLPEDVTGSISGDNISLDLPADSDVTSLVPTIVYNGSELSPGSGEARDFSDPVIYTVSTPEGRKREYSVNAVLAASSSKDILRFQIDGARGTINGSDIALTVPFGTDLSKLPASVIHNGKSVSPASGSTQDFSQPVEYTVTASDGSTSRYRVIVSVAPSDAKDITAFAIAASSAQIDGTQITLALPHGTDLQALQPSITHSGVSVSPEDGSAQDFRGPVQYTVTAADGTTQEYTVLVSITPSNAKEVTRFAIAGRPAAINGTTISLTMPFGTDLARLRPTVQYTGKSLSPRSGTQQDFRQPVVYTVTAADGSTAQYTVTLSVAPNSAKDITTVQILGNSAQIAGTAITLTLPHGTPVTALVPTITHSGAIIQPASGVAQDFTNPVSYVVTAADGSSRTYSIRVTIAASNAKAITAFGLLGMNAAIDEPNRAITLTVAFNTNVGALMPAITHTGASVTPGPSVAQDFRQPVMYTVTAADNTSAVYTVTVTVEKNNAKDITGFSILSRTGTIGDSTITLTVPHGSNLSMLTPTITVSGISVSPASGSMQNFTNPVTYTVTAEDLTTKPYVVTVVEAKSPAKEITSFAINTVQGNFTGTNITLTLPHSTDLHMLTPTIVHTGKSISPASGAMHDFSSEVTYRVTAEDDSVQDYKVNVSLAPASTTKDILTFTIPNGITTFGVGMDTISVVLPMGTVRTALAPTITTSGTTVSPASGATQDFTLSVPYIVTAEDGSMKTYTVTVTAP